MTMLSAQASLSKLLKSLTQAAGGDIAGEAAVLAEGDAADRTDIVFLEKLPLFFK